MSDTHPSPVANRVPSGPASSLLHSALLGLVLVVSGLATETAPARAQVTGFTPNVLPELEVRAASGPIRIDGVLDDEGWENAGRTDYWQETWPGYNVPAGVEIEGWMTYDEENLYFAIVVHDPEPTGLRASRRDRDSIFRDDYVGLILDTYGTGAWAYELFVNPYGIQGDLRWTPNGEDVGFDLVWHSEGLVRTDGWQVEVAVPFQSLRFPDRTEQEWRGTFWYNRPRESRERYSWSAADRDNPCWPCTWGTIRGVGEVDAGGALEFLPSVTGFTVSGLQDRDDPTSSFEEIQSDADFGLGVRYGISSSYAAEATFNPDFSQVESDAAQIEANTTFALFFPERRPFFQEGSDLYRSWINAIYTRSINNPQWATKLTGRTERSSVALLAGRDEDSPLILPFEERSAIFSMGRSSSVIARARRALLEDSHVGALGTFRALDESGGRNAVFGADSMIRFLGNYRVEGQLLFSHTRELDAPSLARDRFESEDGSLRRFGYGDDVHTELLDGESYLGHASHLSLEYSSQHLWWDADWTRTSPTFRADNGFITQNDNERGILQMGGNLDPDNAWLDQVRGFLMFARVWNFDGQRKDEWIRPELNVDFKGQTGLEVGWLTSNENFRGQELRGIHRWNVEIDTAFSEYLSGGVEYESGDFVVRRADVAQLGNGQRFEIGVQLRPLERLTLTQDFEWQRLEQKGTGSIASRGFFEGYVARTRMDLQFSREFFARLILQYDDFDEAYDLEPLFTYRVNPFTSFYVGSTHRLVDFGDVVTDDGLRDVGLEQTERQYFAKLQYFFRR